MREKTIKAPEEASDLELIAVRRGVPITEPFTGTSTSDNCFFVVGPDRPYYDELITQLPSTAVQETALSRVLAKAAELAQKLVPETLYLETLTDAGETSAQNNTSVISVLSVDGRLSIFTGDAGIPALERAMDTLKATDYMPGKAKFGQIPHHGSRGNVGSTFLDPLLASDGTTCIDGSRF